MLRLYYWGTGMGTFVQIPWTLYFTAEEGSLTLDLFNRLGTGGLTGPGRRRTVGGQGIHSGPNNNGYAGYGSPNVPTANINNYAMGSGVGGGPGGGLGSSNAFGVAKEDPVRSTHSLNRPGADAQSMASMGNRSAAGNIAGGGPQTAATGMTEASAPLMTGSSGDPQSEAYAYRAKALYNCGSCSSWDKLGTDCIWIRLCITG